MAGATIKRGRTAQAHRNVIALSSDSRLLEYYSYAFLEKLESVFPKLLLPKYTSVRNAEEKGLRMMADEKYWKTLNAVFEEVIAEENILTKTFGRTQMKRKIENVMLEIAIGAERMRMEKALRNLGLDNAWGRFLDGVMHFAQKKPEFLAPTNAPELHGYARDAFLGCKDHMECLRELFLLEEKDAAKYIKKIAKETGLTNQQLYLIDESLRWKIPPNTPAFFAGVGPKEIGAYISNASNKALENISSMMRESKSMLSTAISDIAEVKEIEYLNTKKYQQRYVGAKEKAPSKLASVIPIRKKAVFKKIATRFAAPLAAGAVIATSVYLAVWPVVNKLADRLEKKIEPAQVSLAGTLENELKPICAFSGNRKEIVRMLSNLKVSGRKLTQGEKLRAIKIAKLSKKKYSGKKLEQYIKVVAVLQFAPGYGNSKVASLSDKVASEAALGKAGSVARKRLEELSKKK